MDATLSRIALEQAKAMAAKDKLDHEVLGSFNSRIAPARAGGLRKTLRMAMTVSKNARSVDRLERTSKKSPAPQGVRVGVASAKSATSHRTYWQW